MKTFAKIAGLFLGAGLAGAFAQPSGALSPLTLPVGQRPAWLRRDGIVMAGSWEPLVFRVRRDGSPGYVATDAQRAAYAREHSAEMIAQLKAMGINFVLTHGYKGGGLALERDGMADAARFTQLCHEAGLRVGAYCDSGTFMWDAFFQEKPEAQNWLLLGSDGQPEIYGRSTYRYFWNRNNPDGQAYYRQITKFAVTDMHVDLIHLDNFFRGPGTDAYSIAQFHAFLRTTFSSAQLKAAGLDDVATVRPPTDPKDTSLLARAWADFCCRSVGQAYRDVGQYARSLRPDVLMESNPTGVGGAIRLPDDPNRMLGGGEAFWDEGLRPGIVKGTLRTRIRTYKAARLFENSAFTYVTNPLEAAEAMAFNLDCLGCVCGFEYGKIKQSPDDDVPVLPTLAPYIAFFHARRDLLRDAQVVADFGVVRSFASMQFSPPAVAKLTGALEDMLIAHPCAFQLVFESQFDRLARWPVLVLAGVDALSDPQVQRLRRYIAHGGRLCVIGPLATHDEWMLPRPRPALDDLPAERVIRVPADGDWLAALHRASGGHESLAVTNADGGTITGLCVELTDQPERRLVHLVNYRADAPARAVHVRVALPKGRAAKAVTLASPDHAQDVSVTFTREADGTASFVVPTIGTYEIAVVALQ